jgi:hypothetical protein
MNTKQLDAAVSSHIDQFLVSMSTLVRQAAVEAVKEALGAGGEMVAAPAKRGPGRPRKVAAATPAAGEEKVAGEVLTYVRSSPGQPLEEIGRGMGTDTAGLKRPTQGLLAARALRTEGPKRGTKYFPGGKGRKTAKAAVLLLPIAASTA